MCFLSSSCSAQCRKICIHAGATVMQCNCGSATMTRQLLQAMKFPAPPGLPSRWLLPAKPPPVTPVSDLLSLATMPVLLEGCGLGKVLEPPGRPPSRLRALMEPSWLRKLNGMGPTPAPSRLRPPAPESSRFRPSRCLEDLDPLLIRGAFNDAAEPIGVSTSPEACSLTWSVKPYSWHLHPE